MGNTNIKYREDVLKSFFKYIKSGESFYIVGAPSAGKTRLIDFVMGDNFDALRAGKPFARDRVIKHYLGEESATKTWLVRVDLNRLRIEYGWDFGFFELLLNTLLQITYRYTTSNESEKIRDFIAPLNSEVIESKDTLRAHRFLEFAIHKICQAYGIKITFLFDEFDEIYKTMPKEIFAYLRAIRDANKYWISYGLFLRNLPEKLRNPEENESFYELISRNKIGLGPFSYKDSIIVIGQLEERLDINLSRQEELDWLYTFSGGHPGFMQALLKLYKTQNFSQMQNIEWCANQEVIQEECRKLWIGLLENEKTGFREFVNGAQNPMSVKTGSSLLLTKGLLKQNKDNQITVFSPLFAHWLLRQ